MLTISRPRLTHIEIIDVRRLAAEVINQHIADSRRDGKERSIQQVRDGMLDPWLEVVDFNTEYGRTRAIEKIRAHVTKEDSRRNHGGKLTMAEVKVSKLNQDDVMLILHNACYYLIPAARQLSVPRGTLLKRCNQLGISTDRDSLNKFRDGAGLRPISRQNPLVNAPHQATVPAQRYVAAN